MHEDLQLWTVRAFDDASARIALPPVERWVPRERRTMEVPLTAYAVIAAALLVGVVVFSGLADRIVPAAPRPTPSGYSMTPGASEAETWGNVWSASGHAAVLRPTWLPVTIDVSKTNYHVQTSGGGLTRYIVLYTRAADVTPQLLLMAEGPDILAARRGPGERSDDVRVRERSAQLLTTDDGTMRVIWSEGDVRYTVQSFHLTRDELLKIAESLMPVVAADGGVGPTVHLTADPSSAPPAQR